MAIKTIPTLDEIGLKSVVMDSEDINKKCDELSETIINMLPKSDQNGHKILR